MQPSRAYFSAYLSSCKWPLRQTMQQFSICVFTWTLNKSQISSQVTYWIQSTFENLVPEYWTPLDYRKKLLTEFKWSNIQMAVCRNTFSILNYSGDPNTRYLNTRIIRFQDVFSSSFQMAIQHPISGPVIWNLG
jgi:hypothetical protein